MLRKYDTKFIIHFLNFGQLNKGNFAPRLKFQAAIEVDYNRKEAKHEFFGVEIVPLENLNQRLKEHLHDKNYASWYPTCIA